MLLVLGFQIPLVLWLLDDKNIDGRHVDQDGVLDHLHCRILDHRPLDDLYPEHAHVSDFYALSPSETLQEIILKNELTCDNVSPLIFLRYLLAKNM